MKIKYFLLTYGKARCILIVQFELARRNAVNHNGGEGRKMYIHEAIKKAQERNAAGQSWGLRRADWGEDYLSFGEWCNPYNEYDKSECLLLNCACEEAWFPSVEELTADDWRLAPLGGPKIRR